MATDKLPEVWLRGPLEGIPALLQPVAHALLQAQEEIHRALEGFREAQLWEHPAGVASVGFHLQHIAGVLDRLFTYAEGHQLSPEQLHYLAMEGKPGSGTSLSSLLFVLDTQLAITLKKLQAIDPATLTDIRGVGRKQVPSTVLGLLFHSAEHTMRHTGQLLVTIKVLQAGNSA